MRFLSTILILAGVTIALGACSNPNAAKNAATDAAREAREIVVPVEAEHPERGAIFEMLDTDTRVEAETKVEFFAQGVGICEEVFFEEGDTVQQGEILAELEKDEVEASLRQLEVQLAQQKAEYERALEGHNDGITPRAELEAKQFAYEQGQESVKGEKTRLARQTIRAPFTGIITKRHVQAGVLVNSGSPVFEMVDPESYILVIRPPEVELERLHVGQRGIATIDALGAEKVDLEIRRINHNVDQSGTLKVVLDIEDEVLPRLREGMFARVSIIMDTFEEALLIPKDAVIEENGRKYVYVVRQPAEKKANGAGAAQTAAAEPEENKAYAEKQSPSTDSKLVAERVEIETGLEDEALFQVVNGLDEGSRVVTLGQYRLSTGTEVTVTNADEMLEERAEIPLDTALERAEAKREDETDNPGNARESQ